MIPDRPEPPSSPPIDLAIDMSPARVGGGVSRVHELLQTLPLLAPQRRYLFIFGGEIPLPTRIPPQIRVFDAPRGYRRTPLRQLWQQFLLPGVIEESGAQWLLSPFNLLPLRRRSKKLAKRAVIVSSISPFAPEVYDDLPAYQKARLSVLRRLTIASVRQADLVFFLSREAFRRLGRHVPSENVRFLPMAPPPPAAVEAATQMKMDPALSRTPFFLMVGELFPYRGVDDAIRALGDLLRRRRRVRLLVCGRPSDPSHFRSLQTLAANLPAGAVSFVGSLPTILTLALMHRSLAVLVCSRIENPSRIPPEAMAMGAPLIVTDIDVFRETCREAALYYPAGDWQALAACMESLLESTIREHLIVAGKERISSLDWRDASRTLLSEMGLLPQ